MACFVFPESDHMASFVCSTCFCNRPSRASLKRHQLREHRKGSLTVTVGGDNKRSVHRTSPKQLSQLPGMREVTKRALVFATRWPHKDPREDVKYAKEASDEKFEC